jgi:phage baseplate assembly protein W
MMANGREEVQKFSNVWAKDLSINLSTVGEILNEDVINQSIELILATLHGERLFNSSFGSDFSLRVFDTIDEDFYEQVLDDTVDAIATWEDRITIIDDKVNLQILPDENTVYLTIPYIINIRRLKAEFRKKITM